MEATDSRISELVERKPKSLTCERALSFLPVKVMKMETATNAPTDDESRWMRELLAECSYRCFASILTDGIDENQISGMEFAIACGEEV